MDMENNNKKLCKYCKSEIPEGAKICPNCRKKQGKSGCLIGIIVVVVLFLLVAIFGSSGDDKEPVSSTVSSNSSSESSASGSQEVAEEIEEPIVYTAYSVSELMSDLDSNPLKAAEKYKNQYVELTGRLSNIDSDGKYISLRPQEASFTFANVSCYIQNDDQKLIIMNKSIDDIGNFVPTKTNNKNIP